MKVIASFIASLLVLATGCAPQPTSQLSQLKTPRSLADLLVNIRQATETGLILKDEFYTEENLKRAFGGATVEMGISPLTQFRRGAIIRGFPAWPELAAAEPAGGPLTLELSRVYYMNLHAEVRLESSARTSLSLGQMERVLGKDWTDQVDVTFPHGRGPVVSNRYIEYRLGDPALQRRLDIWLRDDRTFEMAKAFADEP